MYLLVLGIALLALKLLAVEPVAAWSWWGVLSPFGLAVVWWKWCDWTGFTQRRIAERERKRGAKRLLRSRPADERENIKADF